MKKTELKGYLKDLENKNKKFSFKKTVKILDIVNYIYLNQMKKFNYKQISDYDKAKYLFDEITEQFSYIYDLLNKGKILMATCLLRNIYEEILYIGLKVIIIIINLHILIRCLDYIIELLMKKN